MIINNRLDEKLCLDTLSVVNQKEPLCHNITHIHFAISLSNINFLYRLSFDFPLSQIFSCRSKFYLNNIVSLEFLFLFLPFVYCALFSSVLVPFFLFRNPQTVQSTPRILHAARVSWLLSGYVPNFSSCCQNLESHS